jgi:hypothetical protein
VTARVEAEPGPGPLIAMLRVAVPQGPAVPYPIQS